jgi:translation initiation factor IF-1
MSIEVEGIVREQLPSGLYRVELDGRRFVTAHPAGDIRRNFIRLLAGDRVVVAIAPNDPTRGRVLRRV